VLPLCLDDFERFALLLHPSLVKYGRGLVRRCLVVTPDKDFDEILRRCPSGPYEVLAESTIAPGLRDETAPGWRRQQIVKLTVAELVETRFYLTLDADVMFTRQIGYGDVTRDGRAWFCVRRTGVHADWLRWSERVLLRRGDGAHYAVTPSILATECVHRLLAHIVSLPAPAGAPRPAAVAGRCHRSAGEMAVDRIHPLRHLRDIGGTARDPPLAAPHRPVRELPLARGRSGSLGSCPKLHPR